MRVDTQGKWRALIQQQFEGDITIAQFCKEKQISPTCFYKYKHLLKESKTSNKSTFVKVQPQKVDTSNGMIKIQYHDTRLNLPITIAPEWIANLLKALA